MPTPISAITILACRDTLAAGLLTRVSGMAPVEPNAPESILERAGLPAGVSVSELTAHPRLVTLLEPEHLPALHREAWSRAWRCGAWDIQLSFLPPLAGPELGLVLANTDWIGTEAVRDALIRSAEAGRLASWSWRPMAGGPELRRRAHQGRDPSLAPNGARVGQPPEPAAPIWVWGGSRSWVWRLGTAGTAPGRPTGRRATGRQRAHIVSLRRQLGRAGDPLPAALTMGEASRIITELRIKTGYDDTHP